MVTKPERKAASENIIIDMADPQDDFQMSENWHSFVPDNVDKSWIEFDGHNQSYGPR